MKNANATATVEAVEASKIIKVTIEALPEWEHQSFNKKTGETSWHAKVNLANLNAEMATFLMFHGLKQQLGDVYNTRNFTKEEAKEFAALSAHEKLAKRKELQQKTLLAKVADVEANKVPRTQGEPEPELSPQDAALRAEMDTFLIAKKGESVSGQLWRLTQLKAKEQGKAFESETMIPKMRTFLESRDIYKATLEAKQKSEQAQGAFDFL